MRFGRLVADNVAEVAWHKTQRVTRNEDGTIDFHATVSGLNEISWWILGYGEQAEVLRPAKLRELVAAHAIRMVQRYSPDAMAAPTPLPSPQARNNTIFWGLSASAPTRELSGVSYQQDRLTAEG